MLPVRIETENSQRYPPRVVVHLRVKNNQNAAMVCGYVRTHVPSRSVEKTAQLLSGYRVVLGITCMKVGAHGLRRPMIAGDNAEGGIFAFQTEGRSVKRLVCLFRCMCLRR